MGIVRAETIARMRGAIKKGVSASRFIADMREIGLSYRRTDMLADWRLETGAEKKKGLLRYVRKDRYPSTTQMSGLAPTASKEYLYKLRYEAVLRPGEKPKEQFVNINSDVPMTSTMIEEETLRRWGEWEKYKPEAVTGLQVWSAYRKEAE